MILEQNMGTPFIDTVLNLPKGAFQEQQINLFKTDSNLHLWKYSCLAISMSRLLTVKLL